MKKQIVSVVSVVAVLAISSCDSSKKSTEEVTKDTTEVVQEETGNAIPEEEQKVEVSVVGTVQEINRGKDGYTAKITDEAGKVYNATISIPNLKDPKQYRSVQVGDKITVKGESFQSDVDNYIVVRELMK